MFGVKKETHWLVRIFAFGMLILPIITLAAFSYLRLGSVLKDSTLSRRIGLVDTASLLLKERLDNVVNLGVSLASRVQFRNLIEQGKWQEAILILKQIPDDFYFVDRIFLTDSTGTETADFPELVGGVGRNFAFRDWYKGVKETKKPYVSEAYRRAAIPQYNLVAVAIPITSEASQDLGILVIQIKLDTFFDWTKELSLNEDGAFIYVVDQYGNIVTHPKIFPQEEIKNISSTLIIKNALSGSSGKETIQDPIDNEEHLAFYSPVKDYGWGVVLTQPTSLAYANRAVILRQTGIIYTIIFLLNCFIAVILIYLFNILNTYRNREKSFLESIGDGVVAINRNWDIILWNTAATKITGWSKNEAIGKPFREIMKLIREKDRQENIRFIEEAIIFGKARSMENDTSLIKKSGEEVPVGDSAAPLFDNNGGINGAIIVFRDISQEKENEAIRSSFSYASHQLRTPLTKALWALEIVKEDKSTSPEIKKQVETAYLSLLSIRKFTGAIIEANQIDQGQIITKKEQVKLIDLFESTIKEVKQTSEIQNVSVTAPAISAIASINSDGRLLKRALAEVLENAIQYSKPNSEVKINASISEKELVIEIQDSGIGIPESQQPLVFTKYFRGGNFDTTKISGAGLGLFIAKSYIHLLGGKIWFKSKENAGSAFFVTLPLTEK